MFAAINTNQKQLKPGKRYQFNVSSRNVYMLGHLSSSPRGGGGDSFEVRADYYSIRRKIMAENGVSSLDATVELALRVLPAPCVYCVFHQSGA